MDVSIRPSVLRGKLSVPASKSCAHRSIICAALADGVSHLSGVTMSKDIEATIGAMTALGAQFTVDGGDITVIGSGSRKAEKCVIDCNESGSTLRFIIPIAAALGSDTEFRGRGDEIRVFPFRFADICTLYSTDPQLLLSRYYRYGGMPQVWQTDQAEEREFYLRDLFEKVYFSDIINRYRLRGIEEIGILTDVLASAVGSLTNTVRLQNTFLSERKSRLSINTISSYIEYLKDAFLLSEAKRYDIKGRQ